MMLYMVIWLRLFDFVISWHVNFGNFLYAFHMLFQLDVLLSFGIPHTIMI